MWSTPDPDAGTVKRFSRTVSGFIDHVVQSTDRSLNVIEFGAVWSHGIHSGGV